MRRSGIRSGLCCALLLILPASAEASSSAAPAGLEIEELELANGMRFLFLERPSMPTVEAGWVVRTGSADDPADTTGMSHFIEHMMFKGSRTIGAVNAQREGVVLQRLMAIEEELAGLPRAGRRAVRQRIPLEAALSDLETEARTLTQLGAFSLEYSRAGATRLNANTAEDLTLYYVTLPAETLELWFWLESDRLLDPVFREFKKEKQVVSEERHQRVGSTPTGIADREFERVFWRDSAYGQSALGTVEHLERLSRTQLAEFFDRHYAAPALTGVLIGNFDRERARTLAKAYFGRLESRPLPPTREQTNPQPQTRAQRVTEETLDLTCNCSPQLRIRYPSVAFGHPDQFALQVLAGVLNGRGGRLYRELVLGQELAFAAYAQQTPLRDDGSFTVSLESKGETSTDALLEAWDEQLALLVSQPATPAEISRVQNRLATEHLDQLKDPHLLMRRLLVYAGLGDWRQLGQWTANIRAVEAGDVTAVAQRYLKPEHRLVGRYLRTGATP